jgi:uncharacterized protein (DUF58 family)
MTRRYRPHLPGLIYTGLTGLVALAAINRQNNLLFWILGALLCGLAISVVLASLMMRSLSVRRVVAGHGAVGEALAVRYAVANRSRILPAFCVHVEELSDAAPGAWLRLMAPARAWVMHLGPGETVHGEAVFWPARRGEARFDRMRVWTTFPFGIVRRSITISQPQHTLIYPLMYELRGELLRAVAPQGVAGSRVSSRPGAGDDYYGMREFRPGDSMRHVAWKRSACLDQLVCLERTRPLPARLRVIMNLAPPADRLPAGPGEERAARQLEEKAISLAASIVRAAHRAGFEVGLSLPGTGHPPLLIRRSAWHRTRLLSALAAIDLDAPRAAPAQRAALHGERAAQVVIHPDRVDPSAARDDALHLSARHMEGLVAHAIGWDPSAAAPPGAPHPEAAA